LSDVVGRHPAGRDVDTDRRDRLAAAIEDRHGEAPGLGVVLADVHCVSDAEDLVAAAVELLEGRGGQGRELRERKSQPAGALLGRHPRHERLAHRDRVGGDPQADLRVSAHLVGPVDLLDVDDVGAVEDRQVAALAGLLDDAAHVGKGDPADVQVGDRPHAELPQPQAQAIALRLGILAQPAELGQRACEPVGGAPVDTEAVGELGGTQPRLGLQGGEKVRGLRERAGISSGGVAALPRVGPVLGRHRALRCRREDLDTRVRCAVVSASRCHLAIIVVTTATPRPTWTGPLSGARSLT